MVRCKSRRQEITKGRRKKRGTEAKKKQVLYKNHEENTEQNETKNGEEKAPSLRRVSGTYSLPLTIM